ncbi:2Fe-2S iron-sulfur cluster-binding protein [Mycobacterium sp. NPDC003449]
MTKVTFVSEDSTDISVDVADGTSVMQAAVAHGIGGILADCGGQRQCATCHIYLRPEDFDRLPAMTDDEDEMLEITASERLATSRLSCQVLAESQLAELVVEVPERQR